MKNRFKSQAHFIGKIEDLAALGLGVQEIADHLGISKTSIYNASGSNPEIMAAIARGRVRDKQSLLSIARKRAKKNSDRLLEFLLERQHGLTKQDPEGPSTGPQVVVHIGLPQNGRESSKAKP